ncbi:MAG: hypothetical protein ABJK11_10895 [Balneola sp.]
MKTQTFKSLTTKYRREEDFNRILANNLQLLDLGEFDEVEVEGLVGTRRADIVAKNGEEVLVIEIQFGKADWDHWGRLEAYARLKNASVAVLIAEDFEELMIVTSQLRNEDSNISWYLVKVLLNEHDEYLFIPVEKPAVDIQTERKNIEYSKFWAPIRKEGLFAGKPVPLRDEGWIGKGVNGAVIILKVNKGYSEVLVEYKGSDRIEKRDKLFTILDEVIDNTEKKETSKAAQIQVPVINKGRDNIESWDEIRVLLTSIAEKIYNIINNTTL